MGALGDMGHSSLKPGGTPIVQVDRIFAKLECANPCGSVKDRIAEYIIDQSERMGLLKSGMKIVEASSGNTGIALAYYGGRKGHNVTIVMPENMTEERKKILKDLGAELIECSEGDFAEAASIRDEMARDHEFFNPDQFANPLNVVCHTTTTGREILKQMKGHNRPVEAFVAGVGTGGTLIGVGRALREVYPDVYIVAVEPSESPVMSGGKPGLYGIGGIGDGFIPAIVKGERNGFHEMIDEVICISTEEAKEAALHLQQTYGFCIGVSSGANYAVAKKLLDRFSTIVTVFPNGYEKYQSQGLRHCENPACQYEPMRQAAFRSGKHSGIDT